VIVEARLVVAHARAGAWLRARSLASAAALRALAAGQFEHGVGRASGAGLKNHHALVHAAGTVAAHAAGATHASRARHAAHAAHAVVVSAALAALARSASDAHGLSAGAQAEAASALARAVGPLAATLLSLSAFGALSSQQLA